ncbi:MAG: glycoside hydrolase family 2 TIM barrel-domain containing protein [Phycisphaerales bacterium]
MPAQEHTGPIPVEVVQIEEGWHLLRGGEPYFVRGAGGDKNMELLAELGGNSIRTWGADQLEPREWPDGRIMSVMDRAHELGLSVAAGFWVEHLEGGYIPGKVDYDDPQQVEAQIEATRAFAHRWKDHPALLVWGVGNEVVGDDRPRAFIELNRIAKAIKEIDPNHPTMTVISGVWPDQAELFAKHCPDIDILGVNAYGGLVAVPQELLRQGYEGPYLVTEYGPIGHWETGITPWGAEVEQSSAGKARTYTEFYRAGIANQPDRCLGGYVFLWGQKQERTDTWYSMFLATGEKTAPVDAMARLWSGKEPTNRAPLVEGITSAIASSRVRGGQSVHANVEVTDPDGDPLQFEWVVRRESTDKRAGGDFERAPEDVPGTIEQLDGNAVTLRLPTEPGAYRLHVYVRDGQGGAGTANIPFYIEMWRRD